MAEDTIRFSTCTDTDMHNLLDNEYTRKLLLAMFHTMKLFQFAHDWLLSNFRLCFFDSITVVRQESFSLIYHGYTLNSCSCFLVSLLCTEACFPNFVRIRNQGRILKQYQIKWTGTLESFAHHVLFKNLFSIFDRMEIQLAQWPKRYFALGEAEVCTGKKKIFQTASEAFVMFSRGKEVP